MISRGTFGFLFVALVLFCGATWLGYRAHSSFATSSQLSQNGWCCLGAQRACSVTPGMDECRAQGGIVFNWDQASCNAVCATAKPPRIKTRTSAPAAAGQSPAASQ